MILSDQTIETYSMYNHLITPYNPEQLQPASYDLQLGDIFGVGTDYGIFDLGPKQFILASTLEEIRLPDHIVGRIEGKSSNARSGLIIHTAGFVDPGFIGQLTLEITNLSNEFVPLRKGMLVAQIAFQQMDRPARKPYGHPDLNSHYQNQKGATPSAR